MKIVAVQYENYGDYSGKVYHYFCADEKVQAGDYVVAEVSRNGKDNYHVVRVAEVLNSSNQAKKWVVCRLDLEAYEKLVELEKRKVELRKELEARVAAVHVKEFYAAFAEKDPMVKELLDELNKLEEDTN
jgi:C-terminal processing protease CtpA/Prc